MLTLNEVIQKRMYESSEPFDDDAEAEGVSIVFKNNMPFELSIGEREYSYRYTTSTGESDTAEKNQHVKFA